MRHQHRLIAGNPQQTILEVDDAFIQVQIVLVRKTHVGQQQTDNFLYDAHFYKLFVVCCNKPFDNALQHSVVVQAVYTVLVEVRHNVLGGVVANQQIMKMLLCVLSQQGGRYTGHTVFVDFDERGDGFGHRFDERGDGFGHR